MRAEANQHLMNLWDPLATDDERRAAYYWFEKEVFEWKRERGLLTDDQIELEYLKQAMLEPIMQKNGCGTVCVTYKAPPIPLRRAVRA